VNLLEFTVLKYTILQ